MTVKKRGRPKLAESPTKKKLINFAKQLFRQRGFSRVSVESICRGADASKMTFYRHFSDKQEIALIILDSFLNEEISWSEELVKEDSSYDSKLALMLARREKNFHALGSRFIQEFNQSPDKKVHKFLAKWVERINQVNLDFLALGKSEGKIAKTTSPEVFFFFIGKRNELLADQKLKKICPNSVERHRLIDNFFYYGLAGPGAFEDGN